MNSRKFRQPAFSEVGYHPLRAGCSSVAVLWSPSSFLYQTLTIFTDYSQTPGVCCNYYVANRPLREGAGPLPALLLDLGASYLSSNYPLPFHGREEGDATKFDSMNLINTVRVKEINDERFTERGAGAKHRHQVSDRRNSNERGSDTSSGRGEPGVHDANRRRRRGRLSRVGGLSERDVHWSALLRRSSW